MTSSPPRFLLSIQVVTLLLILVSLPHASAQLNATLYLYPYSFSNCTKATGQELQIFPPWTSAVTKCTTFNLGSNTYYQAELPYFNPTTCGASVLITVWAASAGHTSCGSPTNSTGAAESFNLTVGNADITCNLGIGTPAALGGYVNTNLLPYFNNVPGSCPAAVGPPYQTDLLLYTNSSCSLGTGLYTQVFPPWTPGVQKCTTFYPGPGSTYYQSELLSYNLTAAGCGATLSITVWSAAAGYTTCGSATNFTGAAETGTIAISNLATASQCNYATFDQKPADSGYVTTNLANYISGYATATACSAFFSSSSPVAGSSGSSSAFTSTTPVSGGGTSPPRPTSGTSSLVVSTTLVVTMLLFSVSSITY